MAEPVPPSVALAAATRPRRGETANGDAWAAHWHAGVCRVAVIDGLGHGPAAEQAASVALSVLGAAPDLGPAEALAACHAALAATRGAAMSIARIDPARSRLTYAGVGNVEAQLWLGGRLQRPIVHRGIVGAALPRVRALDFGLPDDWCLLMHTDGVSARFALDALAPFTRRDLQALADAVLCGWGRPTDDATVVVAGPA
jgi:serine phosphatase RsbU (regulator of sigma subunit)